MSNELITTEPLVPTNELSESDYISRLGDVLREAFDDALNWQQVGGEPKPATYTGGLPIWDMTFSNIRGRSNGRHHPFYDSEFELQRMRSACRKLATYSAIAIGAQKALQVYVMGGDWEYDVEAKEGVDAPEGLLEECNVILKANLERNEFIACLDNQVLDHTVEDGEVLVAGYATPDGLTDLRLWQADLLREPRNPAGLDDWLLTSGPSSWSFGVHTGYDDRMKQIDHTKHLGYHVVFDDAGKEWDYLPSWPQQNYDADLADKFGHLIKRNVPLTAKRGVSDYYAVLNDLEREDKLNENTTVGAAILAAIPWFEVMPKNTTKEAGAGQLKNALDGFSRAIKNAGSTNPQRRFKAGSIQVVSDREYVTGPMGQARSPIYIEVGKAVTRRIGQRWVFPYYMISGDASESSLASTLVAEAPFVKARQADQGFYAAHFRKVCYKMLKIAADAGRFRTWGIRDWAGLKDAIQVRITPSPVASRNKKEQLDELFGMYDRQIMEANEVRTALRLDPKEELEGQTGRGVGAAPADPNADSDPQGEGERTQAKTPSNVESQEVSRRSAMMDAAIWEDYP